MSDQFSTLLGGSIYLRILGLFLENPDEMLTLSEISRRVMKNPGSIFPIIPRLVENGLLLQRKVGKVSSLYYLNKENEVVLLLIQLVEDVRNVGR